MLILLTLELFGSHDLGPGEHESFVGNGGPTGKVRNKRVLVDTMAVGKGVPIQENIPGNGLAVHGAEHVQREFLFYFQPRTTGRSNQRNAEILGDMPPEPDLQTGIKIGVHIAEGTANVGHGTESQLFGRFGIK